MNDRLPWSRDELKALLPKLESRLAEAEADNPECRPLPPMSLDEVFDYFDRLLSIATSRAITGSERFLFEQLLSNFRMAILAQSLGKKGRYFVLSEDDISKLIKAET